MDQGLLTMLLQCWQPHYCRSAPFTVTLPLQTERTPLHYASTVAVVKLLLDKRANLNTVNQVPMPPHAYSTQRRECASWRCTVGGGYKENDVADQGRLHVLL